MSFSMKTIPVQDAVGTILCQDITRIVPGQYKGPVFRKGHVVTEEDIPVLLDVGKEHLYVYRPEPGMVHEEDAAWRIARCVGGANLVLKGPKEGRIDFARYLLFPYIPGAGELVVVCAALAGAGLAFLWFNAHPAQVFMGDVGALALGGTLGTVAVIARQELVLAIMGGIFVVETLSVMIQTTYFRLSGGKRVFLMAPIHHHFELKGWKETQVVTRFWIITFILVLIGLSTLKIR